ncbi:copper amine oxidase N-terminal domain-containing protein [Lysinibacillus sp. FSL H8-0500]|uniref:copper amine oxidase N-terminal domain-containing protein n=1 Tax=Lysinibacillus sp. FSL H8-0500 TaxID=2921393 RepID=UPI003100B913
MLKRLFFASLLLCLCSLGYIGSSNYAHANNGEVVLFDSGTVINGRTMLPMRSIFESLNATVAWDASKQTVTASRGNTTIQLKVGSKKAFVNGKETYLDSPAVMINSTTMVPVRFIGEALNLPVEWDAFLRVVKISAKEKTIFVYVDDPLITSTYLYGNKYYQLEALTYNISLITYRLQLELHSYPNHSQEYRNILGKQLLMETLKLKAYKKMEAILLDSIMRG